MANTENAELKSEPQVRCDDLLGCPFCGGKAAITEMRYSNTRRLYGYMLKCGGCDLEIKEEPVCWPAGKENEEMLEAKAALVTRWNRRQPNND